MLKDLAERRAQTAPARLASEQAWLEKAGGDPAIARQLKSEHFAAIAREGQERRRQEEALPVEERIERWIARNLAGAPPLTPAQVETIVTTLLRGRPPKRRPGRPRKLTGGDA